ncbi:hypothetical protein Pa4123_20560 [Phytohabitans aurantiacus]|uniref:Uncharacterized protein n=2 Tax=Phytohabitans aurantiacus TaxID=3016789 RepID=A0ABQ5QR97_9ACTN|nr:hypothetical protein Pa4123_20560 [Phytohabitans aurantiacus]
MDFYVKALERDGVGFVILQLIEHPEDISAVISMLERRNDNSFEKARKVISDLMGADLYNPADLDPIRDHALRRLWEALSASGARWEPEAPSDEMKSGH